MVIIGKRRRGDFNLLKVDLEPQTLTTVLCCSILSYTHRNKTHMQLITPLVAPDRERYL